jgi:DNA-binding transcriptional regulator PaaX
MSQRNISDTAYETIYWHVMQHPMSSIVGTVKHTGYSYGTVRAAIAEMVQEGAIIRRRIGKGSQHATYANFVT